MIDLYRRIIVFFLITVVLGVAASAVYAATPPRMRPYTGIGVVVFPQSGSRQSQDLPLQLYEEPGLLRVDVLNISRLTGNEWVFGMAASPLVVSARKDGWLRVFYDDAGRQAWIDPLYKGSFQPWDEYLRLQTVRLLPGLQPHYYRLQQQPNGKQLATLTPKQVFKVLTIEDSWGMVLVDQALIGWLRWRDEDGRLLVGINP